MFASFADRANHHGAGRDAVWCKATLATQDLLIARSPERYFKPPYVGPSGWVGMHLDGSTDWADVAERLRHAHELAGPARACGPPQSPQPDARAGSRDSAPSSVPARQSGIGLARERYRRLRHATERRDVSSSRASSVDGLELARRSARYEMHRAGAAGGAVVAKRAEPDLVKREAAARFARNNGS